MNEDIKNALVSDLEADPTVTISLFRQEIVRVEVAKAGQMSCVQNFGHIGSRARCRAIDDLIG